MSKLQTLLGRCYFLLLMGGTMLNAAPPAFAMNRNQNRLFPLTQARVVHVHPISLSRVSKTTRNVGLNSSERWGSWDRECESVSFSENGSNSSKLHSLSEPQLLWPHEFWPDRCFSENVPLISENVLLKEHKTTKKEFEPIMSKYYLEHRNENIELTIPGLRKRLNDYSSTRGRLDQMARRHIQRTFCESITLKLKETSSSSTRLQTALKKNHIIQVSPKMFPGQMKDLNRMFFLITPEFFTLETTENTLLKISRTTEAKGLSNPLFSFVLDPYSHTECKKQEQTYVQWMKASLLGDGHLRQDKICDFVQGLNVDHTHTPYFLSMISKIPSYRLTPNCFTLSRGIKLTKPKNGLTTTWKTRVRLSTYAIPEMNGIYEDIYSRNCQNEGRNYKKIPSEKYMTDFFIDPGFTMAHLHMQDGGLFLLKEGLYTPVLHVQTRNVEERSKLAWGIYKHCGLKYIEYEDRTKNAYPLDLCPGSIDRFIDLVAPHMHPCFSYKMPSPLNCNNSSTRVLIKRKVRVFHNQHKTKINQIEKRKSSFKHKSKKNLSLQQKLNYKKNVDFEKKNHAQC